MEWFSQTREFLITSFANPQTRVSVLSITGASFTLGFLLTSLLSGTRTGPGKILPSPLTTLIPILSDVEKRNLPLPPDVLPGARDVSTPYGSIRIYEWGPERGRKVLLIHGITTPCLSLGGVAHALVDSGCRVMLFDLFGRGYSDCPSDIPQDHQLFTTQILLALTSSPLSWTGIESGRFCLIGYSLGGGIAAGFASYFPSLVSSLILLAPAGLLHDDHISFQSRVFYSRNVLPRSVLHFLVGLRLRAGPLASQQLKNHEKTEAVGVDDALKQELPRPTGTEQRMSRVYPTIALPEVVKWQVHHHAGFVRAFISSMHDGPILQRTQLEHWRRLGDSLTRQRGLSLEEQRTEGFQHAKVLVMCGEHDNIIRKDELVADATAALQGNVEFRFFDDGHDFPITGYEEVARLILEFWT